MVKSNIVPNKYISPYSTGRVSEMQSKVSEAMIGSSRPVYESLVVNVADLALIWTDPSRSPEHLRAWKTRLLREFPELHGAIEGIVSEVTGEVSKAT